MNEHLARTLGIRELIPKDVAHQNDNGFGLINYARHDEDSLGQLSDQCLGVVLGLVGRLGELLDGFLDRGDGRVERGTDIATSVGRVELGIELGLLVL